MAIDRENFGALPDGRKAYLYTLDDDCGVTVKITNYGGIIVSMRTPDRHGRQDEIGIGFDNLEDYLTAKSYYGSLIGRVGNRIKNGRFTLEGKEYQLWTNSMGEHLHGGRHGFNAKLWDSAPDGDRLRLSYISPDGEERYPGDLSVKVWYSLKKTDLRIDYEATTDKTTIVNLTNHAYFNLNCFQSDVLGHEMRIQADDYNPVDKRLIPTGEIRSVKGTPYDFTTPKRIGQDIEHAPGGYDNNFIFKKKTNTLDEWLVEVRDPDSGRTLAMATTEPCVQFYSGNFLTGALVGLGRKVYKKHYGFCLEAQKPPDAINHPNFISIVLKPGEVYRQTTIYRFGVQ